MKFEEGVFEIQTGNINMYELIMSHKELRNDFLQAMSLKEVENPTEKDVEEWLTEIEDKLYN